MGKPIVLKAMYSRQAKMSVLFLGRFPERFTQYKVAIVSPVTDICTTWIIGGWDPLRMVNTWSLQKIRITWWASPCNTFVMLILKIYGLKYEPRHDKTNKWLCAQRKLRSAWASAQSDQSLRCPHEENLGPKLHVERTAKTLIRLGGGPGWSESSLGTHSLCWFCHEAAHTMFCFQHYCSTVRDALLT